jgi:hypothetical protein
MTEWNAGMLRVPPRRIGRAGYWFRLGSQTAAWRGKVNRSRCAWASSGRANNSVISACRAACVLAAQPIGSWGAHQRHGGEAEVCAPSLCGSTRAGPTGPGRAAARPSVDGPRGYPCKCSGFRQSCAAANAARVTASHDSTLLLAVLLQARRRWQLAAVRVTRCRGPSGHVRVVTSLDVVSLPLVGYGRIQRHDNSRGQASP